MHSERNYIRLTDLFSWFLLGMLLFFSTFFYVERLYGDSAYYLYRIVNDGKFIIEHGRPISYLTQLFPLMLVKFHAPLKYIILAHSLNEWAYFFAAWVVLRYALRSPFLALGLVVCQVTGIKWNYFNPVSELVLSAPLYFILFALLQSKSGNYSRKDIIAIAVLSALIILNHPLSFITLPAIITGSHLLTGQKPGMLKTTVYAFLSMLIIAVYFRGDQYDAETMQGKASGLETGIHNIINFRFGHFFVDFLKNRIGTLCLFVTGIVLSVKTRNYWLAGFLPAFFMGFQLLVIYKFADYFPDTYEPFERYLFPVTIFLSLLCFPLIAARKAYLAIFFLFSISLYHGIKIFKYGLFVRQRYVMLDQALSNTRQFPEQKIAYRAENFHTISPSGHDWILVDESVLVSVMGNHRDLKQVFVLEGVDQRTALSMQQDEYFYSPTWVHPMSGTNQGYFPFRAGPLRIANTDSIQSAHSPDFFNRIDISINAPTKLSRGEEYISSIRLENSNTIPLTSGCGKEKVTLSYAWFHENGAESRQDHALQTRIMSDVSSHTAISQFMKIKAPNEAGNYSLRACLLYNDTIKTTFKTTQNIKVQ